MFLFNNTIGVAKLVLFKFILYGDIADKVFRCSKFVVRGSILLFPSKAPRPITATVSGTDTVDPCLGTSPVYCPPL